MKQTLKALKYVDWILAIATVAYGAYAQDPLIAGVGALGLAMAWYSPAERVKRAMEKRFLRKAAPAPSAAADVAAEDAMYQQVTEAADAAAPELDAAPAAAQKPSHFGGSLAAGQLYLHSSKHNLLRPVSFQFQAGQVKSPWA